MQRIRTSFHGSQWIILPLIHVSLMGGQYDYSIIVLRGTAESSTITGGQCHSIWLVRRHWACRGVACHCSRHGKENRHEIKHYTHPQEERTNDKATSAHIDSSSCLTNSGVTSALSGIGNSHGQCVYNGRGSIRRMNK